MKCIVNVDSEYMFKKYYFPIYFRKKNVNVPVNDVMGLTTTADVFSTSHIALLGKACWYKLFCFLQKLLLSMQLEFEVLFVKGSWSKYCWNYSEQNLKIALVTFFNFKEWRFVLHRIQYVNSLWPRNSSEGLWTKMKK